MSLAAEFVAFQPDQLVVWAGNPRKTIDPSKLAELAASIKARGIDHPITVRATAAGEVEIIAGQRRFLAAKIAGLQAIPCRVRDLTDDEALELAIAENAARADVSPIEEAEAIESYLASGRTIEQAADRFGRTVAWVTGRTRLLALSPAWRERVASDRCPLRHAELLSRLSPSVQAEAAKRWDGREMPAFYDFERAVQLMLHRLAEAPFAIADESYPRGSCDACPSRSDKQRDLFSTEADEDASCLDPTCWAAKVEHAWEVALKSAKKRKLRVLSADDVKIYDNGVASHASEWVEMALAAKEDLAPTAIARSADGLIVELVSRRAYVEACEARRLRLKAALEAQAAERGAAKAAKPAKAAEPEPDQDDEDEATAPTIPPSAPTQDEDHYDPNDPPTAQELKQLAADAETLAIALIDIDRARVEKAQREALRFIGMGILPGAQAVILEAIGADGKSWDRALEEEPVSALIAALLIDNVLAQARPGDVAARFGARPAAPAAPAVDAEIARMVERFAGEIEAARAVDDLIAAWRAIMSEDHRASLPTLAGLWLARAKAIGVKPTMLRNLRKSGDAPATELTKEAA